jgi:hypothetical protein
MERQLSRALWGQLEGVSLRPRTTKDFRLKEPLRVYVKEHLAQAQRMRSSCTVVAGVNESRDSSGLKFNLVQGDKAQRTPD